MTHKPNKIAVIGTGATVMRALAGNHTAKVTQPVTSPPEISGPHGSAWLCDIAKIRETLNIPEDQDGALDHWVVEAPWAHPAWHSYSIILVHLRPMPGGGHTIFYLDGATHELWVYALDPTADRQGIISGVPDTLRLLQPMNFAAQFIATDDEAARARVRRCVQDICEGRLSPDTDFHRAWVELFGDNMLKDRYG